MMRLSTKTLEKKPIGTKELFCFARPLMEGVGWDIKVEGAVTKLERGYLVELDAHWWTEATCDRCLRDLQLDLGGRADETVGDPETDMGSLVLEGHVLDVEPLVEETAVLAWPAKILCGEGCLGLCDRCGKDLNEGPCECPRPVRDPRFEVLKNLHLEDE